MPESTASKTERINDYIADVTHVSLHTADPGGTGASEVNGGSPAYARRVPSFVAAGAGVTSTTLSTSLTFDVPGSTTVAYYGLWKNSVWLGGELLSTSETFNGQGVYVLNGLPITA